MTKAELLEILKLLSALEGWSYGQKIMIPNDLHEQLDAVVRKLSEEVLR